MKTTDIIEGIGDGAHQMEKEHYLQTVRARAYHLAKDSIALYHMLKDMHEETDPGRINSMAAALNAAQSLLTQVKSNIEFEGVVPPISTHDLPTLESVSAGGMGAASIATVAKPIGSKKKQPLIRR